MLTQTEQGQCAHQLKVTNPVAVSRGQCVFIHSAFKCTEQNKYKNATACWKIAWFNSKHNSPTNAAMFRIIVTFYSSSVVNAAVKDLHIRAPYRWHKYTNTFKSKHTFIVTIILLSVGDSANTILRTRTESHIFTSVNLNKEHFLFL